MNSLHPTIGGSPFGEAIEHVLLDVWGTGWFGPDPEPTKVIYDGLDLQNRGVSLKDEYLEVAMTLQLDDPHQFLNALADRYRTNIPASLYGELNRVVHLENSELMLGRILPKPVVFGSTPLDLPKGYAPNRAGMFEDVYPCLTALQGFGVRNHLATNTWRLTKLRKVLEAYGVAHFFDHVLVSGELGIAKQAGVDFFLRCASIIGAMPYKCAAVDDNLLLGVVPAVLAGMRGVLIDRFRQYTDEHGRSRTLTDGSPKYPEIERLNIQVIQSLDELPGVLGYRSVRAA